MMRLRLVVLVALASVVLGTFLRFYHLDRKVLWDDEVYTSIRALGETEGQIVLHAAAIVNGRELRAILHPVDDPSASPESTVHGLIDEEPHHAPPFYVAEFLWVHTFGNSVESLRLLPAFFGVAAIPCMFFLCLELFGSRRAGWLGVALFALSPIAVLFSQEAREYSLWSIAMLALGAVFLRAMRVQTMSAWAIYALVLGASLYVHPFTIWPALGQAIYALALRRPGGVRRVAMPLAATAIGCALYLPWFAILVHNLGVVQRDMATIEHARLPIGHTLRSVADMLKLDVLDFDVQRSLRINATLSLAAAFLYGYAVWVTVRETSRPVWSFVLLSILSPVLPLVLLDLFAGGQRTTHTRYFLPLFIGLNLVLVALFEKRLYEGSVPWRRAWAAAFVAVLLARTGSCIASARAQTWWTKLNQNSIALARTIDATRKPLLISDLYVGPALSIGNYLKPTVAVSLRPRCYECRLPTPAADLATLKRIGSYSDVFVLGPSPDLSRRIAAAIALAKAKPRYHCIDVRANCTSDLVLMGRPEPVVIRRVRSKHG